jgi:hypothetical protein
MTYLSALSEDVEVLAGGEHLVRHLGQRHEHVVTRDGVPETGKAEGGG